MMITTESEMRYNEDPFNMQYDQIPWNLTEEFRGILQDCNVSGMRSQEEEGGLALRWTFTGDPTYLLVHRESVLGTARRLHQTNNETIRRSLLSAHIVLESSKKDIEGMLLDPDYLSSVGVGISEYGVARLSNFKQAIYGQYSREAINYAVETSTRLAVHHERDEIWSKDWLNRSEKIYSEEESD